MQKRENVWQEIEQELKKFRGRKMGLPALAEMIVAVGTKPLLS